MLSNKKKLYSSIAITFAVLIIAAIQTFSLWLPIDEKVDESELVYYAVGFFGGDFDPHWYGYGGVGMYLLYAWYMLIYIFLSLFSITDNINEYAIQLFNSEFFIDAGRYLFSILGLITILIYSRILNKVSIKYSAIVFFLLAITAPETIFFSNYIRTDQIVALLISILFYALLFYNDRKKLFSLAIITALLVSSKISTLLLGCFLFYFVAYYFFKKIIGIKEVVYISVLFFLVTFLAQPFNTIIEHFLFTFERNTSVDPVLGNLSFLTKFSNAYLESFKIVSERINSYLLWVLPTIIFLQSKYKKPVLLLLLLIFIFILPFAFGNGVVRGYWLNSVFDLTRFLCVLLLINFMEKTYIWSKNKFITSSMLTIAVVYTLFILFFNIKNYIYFLNTYEKLSNKAMAKQWVETNLEGHSNILIDGYFNHIMPNIYDPGNINENKDISKVFIFNRNQNQYLNKIFETFLFQKKDKENVYHTINQLRLDFFEEQGENILLSEFKIGTQETTYNWVIKKYKDIEVFKANKTAINFKITGDDPYLIFDLNPELQLNGSPEIHFISNKIIPKVQIFWNLGDGFKRLQSKIVEISKGRVVLPSLAIQSNYVKKARKFDIEDDTLIKAISGSYFITSPAIYNRLINKKIIQTGHRNIKIGNMTDYYHFMLSNKLIKEFKSGLGPIIQIYKIN